MFTIGETVRITACPVTPNFSLVTQSLETDIVRDFTVEELVRQRRHPELLGPFAGLSACELRERLGEYQSFLVEMKEGDYKLVIGFKGAPSQPQSRATVLYAAPTEADRIH